MTMLLTALAPVLAQSSGSDVGQIGGLMGIIFILAIIYSVMLFRQGRR